MTFVSTTVLAITSGKNACNIAEKYNLYFNFVILTECVKHTRGISKKILVAKVISPESRNIRSKSKIPRICSTSRKTRIDKGRSTLAKVNFRLYQKRYRSSTKINIVLH